MLPLFYFFVWVLFDLVLLFSGWQCFFFLQQLSSLPADSSCVPVLLFSFFAQQSVVWASPILSFFSFLTGFECLISSSFLLILANRLPTTVICFLSWHGFSVIIVRIGFFCLLAFQLTTNWEISTFCPAVKSVHVYDTWKCGSSSFIFTYSREDF